MDSIGKKLKIAREKKNMGASEVAKTIKISTHYVEAIEKDEFDKLIAPIYAKGFIKLYAQCVQIDPAPLLRQFSALEVSAEPAPAGRKLPDKKEVFFRQKRRILNIRFAGLIAVIKKIKLPEIRQFSVPSLKPLEVSAKKWLVLIIVAMVVCAAILPILVKHMTVSNAKLRVPPACRWIADPPEPYLNMPVQQTPNSR